MQPSADGTIYAVSPGDGAVRWAFDTGTPIRSSPAVDADGHVYVGGGDGNLYVLNPDGTLRFAMKLIDDVRNDLNSSPALGTGRRLPRRRERRRCSACRTTGACAPTTRATRAAATTPPARPDGASLSWVNTFGDAQPAAPATSIPGNAPDHAAARRARAGGQQLAVLDSTDLGERDVNPPSHRVDVDVSGDGKFLSITPAVAFAPGPLTVERDGQLPRRPPAHGPAPQRGPGRRDRRREVLHDRGAALGGALDPTAIYELSRLSLPLPTVLPSYNQIGFDSLHYLLGTAEAHGLDGRRVDGRGEAAARRRPVGGRPGDAGDLPDGVRPPRDDVTTMKAASGLTRQPHELHAHRSTRSGWRAGSCASGAPTGTAELSGAPSAAGFDVLRAVPRAARALQPADGRHPRARGRELPRCARTSRRLRRRHGDLRESANAITATVTGSHDPGREPPRALLVVDASTGLPVPLQYGTATTHTTALDGTLAGVSVPTDTLDGGLPASMRVHLMVDTASVASGTLP